MNDENTVYSVRLGQRDQRALSNLAETLQVSRADAARLAIRAAADAVAQRRAAVVKREEGADG